MKKAPSFDFYFKIVEALGLRIDAACEKLSLAQKSEGPMVQSKIVRDLSRLETLKNHFLEVGALAKAALEQDDQFELWMLLDEMLRAESYFEFFDMSELKELKELEETTKILSSQIEWKHQSKAKDWAQRITTWNRAKRL